MPDKPVNITRASIARDITEAAPGTSSSKSSSIVDTIIRSIRDALLDGEEVKISGFGKFVLKHKAPRRGRNPATGEPITISARDVVKFKASNVLKRQINRGPQEDNEL